MNLPIAPGVGRAAPSPSNLDPLPKHPAEFSQTLDQKMSARSAPTTPENRVPVVDRSKVDPGLLKAAQGIEAMYLDYVMGVMRKSVPDNDFDLDSPATKIYQGMMDSEFAKAASQTGGIGLTDQIIAYLADSGATSYNQRRGQPVPRTGGTNEGQPKQQSGAEPRVPEQR